MSGGWSLVVAVLVVGLAAGVLLAWRLRRAEPEATGERDRLRADLDDLERRQQELYARLRAAAEVEERSALEEDAARNLRAIERLRASLGEPARRVGGGEAAAPAAAAPTARPAATRTVLAGFAAGVAATALLTWLVLSAQRDAAPRAEATAAPAAAGEEHPAGPELAPEDRQRLEALRGRLAATPEDLNVRKQYALALLGAGQFFPAFQEARDIQTRVPGDPDGLYVEGMVRLQMGQDELAVELLDRVLGQYPQHVLALTAKGVALYRGGNALGARMLWQQAIDASGGRNPQVEHLLELLEERAAADEAGTPSGAPPATAPAAAPPPAPPAPAGGAYRVRIELGAGQVPPPGATLFVSLRGEAPGPPVAVKRLAAPSFPLEIELAAEDSMLGQPLPERGTVVVRLDADGNVSTRGAGDLAAETAMALGSSSVVTLESDAG